MNAKKAYLSLQKLILRYTLEKKTASFTKTGPDLSQTERSYFVPKQIQIGLGTGEALSVSKLVFPNSIMAINSKL